MKRIMFFLCVISILCCGMAAAQELHPPMRLDRSEMERMARLHESAPRAYMDPAVRPLRGSVDLLDYLDYSPDERNQGTCGNCWVWAGTGILEIAFSVQKGIYDRLSIQYMNSCGTANGKYCCCGGLLDYLVGFYTSRGAVIPWSNANAGWQDSSKICESGSSGVTCAAIATSPNYSFTSITQESIGTHGVGQQTAIDNIKNVLNQNRAVWFAFYVCDGGWTAFNSFWSSQAEDALFDFNQTCDETPCILDDRLGHAVLCVGYNDDDPGNRYWIMLNSWGTTAGRPNGLFRVNMDMNYDCEVAGENSLYWETLNVNLAPPPPTPTPFPAGFSVTLNKSTFSPGDTFTVHVSLDDSRMDFYFYLVAVEEWGGTHSILHGGGLRKGIHKFYPRPLMEIHQGFAADIVSLIVPNISGSFTLQAATIPDSLPQTEATARGEYGRYTETYFDIQR